MPGKHIIVLGSSNTDLVIKTTNFPLPGETLLAGDFFIFPGGKGANQAVAAARLGGKVTFIAKIGTDIFGNQSLENFRKEGISTDFIIRDPGHPSGVALITVDGKGENTILVAQGSNKHLLTADVKNATPAFSSAEILLIQLEIPMETVVSGAAMADRLGKKVILNPAPASPLPEEIYKHLFLITPNEAEAAALTGIPVTTASLPAVAKAFVSKGVRHVVITLGKAGAYLFTEDHGVIIPAPVVNAIDTTAAGDIFNGALAVALADGRSLPDGVAFANQCAAMSVTKMGAQSSAPYRHEINF